MPAPPSSTLAKILVPQTGVAGSAPAGGTNFMFRRPRESAIKSRWISNVDAVSCSFLLSHSIGKTKTKERGKALAESAVTNALPMTTGRTWRHIKNGANVAGMSLVIKRNVSNAKTKKGAWIAAIRIRLFWSFIILIRRRKRALSGG